MMQRHTVEYFDWFKDVQPALCEKLGIEQDYFRDYHKLDNSPAKGKYEDYTDYKDFWHVWLEIFGEQVRNDAFCCTYIPYDNDESWDFVAKSARESRGEWATKLVTAMREVCRENELCDKRMVIWFSW